MAARDEDFLGEGTADPFTGLAPAEDPSTAEAAARARGNRWNIATSTQRGDYEREAKQRQLNAEFYDNPDSVIDAYVHGKTGPDGARVSKEQADAARHSKKLNHDAMNTGAYKALTYGILAAPAAITSTHKAEADIYRHQRDECGIKLARYEAIALKARMSMSLPEQEFKERSLAVIADLVALHKEG